MNPLAPATSLGTAGELLVQLRLWQFGVQSAPPLKDSGNDLIAVRGAVFRAVQVKTTVSKTIPIKAKDVRRKFHVLALVFAPKIPLDGTLWSLDEATIFLIEPPGAPCNYPKARLPVDCRLRPETVEKFWPRE
jgi:hypothetical protein